MSSFMDDSFDWSGLRWHRHVRLAELECIRNMTTPVRCRHCGRVYDLGRVTITGRWLDCTAWTSPCCKIPVDDRVPGMFSGTQPHYDELDKETGLPRQR